jgi:hypothetical protein
MPFCGPGGCLVSVAQIASGQETVQSVFPAYCDTDGGRESSSSC